MLRGKDREEEEEGGEGREVVVAHALDTTTDAADNDSVNGLWP